MRQQLDREKVIKGLECCGVESDWDCNECPYGNPNVPISECIHPLMIDAVALLKEREPVKPIKQKQLNGYMFSYACGECGTFLLPLGISAQYCYHCGRSVKWNE